MDRPRTLHPLLLERMKGLSFETQNFLLRLPFACDDAGRVVLDLAAFSRKLLPFVDFAEKIIPRCLDELESRGWIEAYRGGDLVLLRLVHWRRDVIVADPVPSSLPPSPNEAPDVQGPERTTMPPGPAPAPDEPPLQPAARDVAPPHLTVDEPTIESSPDPSPEPAPEPVKKSVEEYLAQLWGTAPAGRSE